MSKKLPRLTMKRLMTQCRKELKRWKSRIQVMDYEALVQSAMNITMYQLYKRNKDHVQSLKFSDFLKEEPYLDHFFYRICRELDEKQLNPRKRIYSKRQTKKFGVFDVDGLEQRNKDGIKAEALPLEPESPEPFPWEVKIDTD